MRCLPYSDGLEVPEGLAATLLEPTHLILAGIEEPLPPILGLNKLEFRGDDASTLLAVCQYRGKDWTPYAAANSRAVRATFKACQTRLRGRFIWQGQVGVAQKLGDDRL